MRNIRQHMHDICMPIVSTTYIGSLTCDELSIFNSRLPTKEVLSHSLNRSSSAIDCRYTEKLITVIRRLRDGEMGFNHLKIIGRSLADSHNIEHIHENFVQGLFEEADRIMLKKKKKKKTRL